VTVARALVGLRDVLWRDAVLAALCPGWLADDAVGAGCAGVARAAVEGLDPGSVLERLGAFVRLTPRVEAAPGLTVLAQAAWARGEGAIASVALEEALAVDPCYRLAQLLDRLVAAGVRMPSDAA
jgi:hypothetical protein